MNKAAKRILITLIAIVAIVFIGNVYINNLLKNKFETFIRERLPENMVRTFDDIDVETFSGSLSITNASLIIKNKEDSVEHTFVNVEKLKISDISYWNYLFNDEIHVESILLENPTIAYYQDRRIATKDTVRKAIATIYKPIVIDHIKIKNTKLVIFEKGKDSTKIYTDGLSLEVNGITISNETVLRKIPFDYKAFNAKSDTVFVKVSPYENLTVEGFSVEKNNAIFKNLKLKTKYSKKELSKIITKERDYYNLSLQSLTIDDFDFGFNNNKFFTKTKLVSLDTPSIEIYRDKLVADDPKIKPLYSKMLRDLPFAITVDSLKIIDAKIKYEERQKVENMGGSINFENLNAAIANVSNTYKSPTRTSIKLKAKFMDDTPLTANWSFDVQNLHDQFLFKAELGSLQANKLNSFTEPNLMVSLNGRTNKTFFTIDGNSDTSKTDMKISYTDFTVMVLREDGKRKNRFLSTIANIFIPKNSTKKGDNYRDGSAEATRDKTKSIFNFFWVSIKASLIKILI